MEQQKKGIKDAQKAVDRAFSTGKVDRATITRRAQLDAAEAVAMAGIAMESDEEADEAARLAIIAANMGNRKKARAARERERVTRNKARADHKAATRSAKQAYEAIKFSDPNSLGFLRVVQVLFLTHIVSTLLMLLLTSRDTIVYSSATIVDWIMVVLESVAFYFFVNRYKLGKPLVLGIASFGIVAHVVSSVATGTTDPVSMLFGNAFYLFLIAYFSVSDRVDASLVNDLSSDKGAMDDDDFAIERTGWPFYRNLIIYFVVFSVLGHWMEAAFCQLIRLGIVQGEYHPENTMLWRDWFYPYPMHGTVVVLMALILYPLFISMKKRFSNRVLPYVASFFINMLTCTLIELVGGLMFNANLQNWDYSNLPFNFMGQVCLQNAIGFGIAASVISWWVYPMLEHAIARVRPATMNIVCIVVAVAGGILFSLYAISPPEGIDLGQNSPQVKEEKGNVELAALGLDVAALERQTKSIDASLSTSSALSFEERQKLKEHVDALNTELGAFQKELAGMKEAHAGNE